jgi:hypothetical protein
MKNDSTDIGMVSPGGLFNVSVSVSASPTVVKASAGRLCRVLVTTTGSNPLVIYDNASAASGTIIGQLPVSPALGCYQFDTPALLGITVAGSATNPAVTICYE